LRRVVGVTAGAAAEGRVVKHRVRAAVIAAVALLVLVTAVASAAVRSPIVSPRADPYFGHGSMSGTKGFGQSRPREIYYGGDPTGAVCSIHWHSWGGRIARGTGIGFYVGPHQIVAQGHFAVTHVIASKLGTWHGRRAYNRLDWSFPDHGRDRAGGSAPCA
jgi:hypothetical protein